MGTAEPDIIPRDLKFDILGNGMANWLGGDGIKTASVDTFAVLLPAGERFFITSLRHYAAEIDDPELKGEIKGYASQEAFHTREHESYNASLRTQNYDVDDMEAFGKQLLDQLDDPLDRLLVTCSLEHLTATISTAVLRNPGVWKDAAPAYRRLWTWHSVEELEHQAVALNVLKHVCADMPAWKRYYIRIRAMNLVMANFAKAAVHNMWSYARRNGIKAGVSFWLSYVRALIVDPGFVRLGFGTFLRYYMPGFDPARRRDEALIRRGRERLAREVAEMTGSQTAAG